jgi:Pyruvate/2-oxoacid:ferredoxin oxidoreductase delta subunit
MVFPSPPPPPPNEVCATCEILRSHRRVSEDSDVVVCDALLGTAPHIFVNDQTTEHFLTPDNTHARSWRIELPVWSTSQPVSCSLCFLWKCSLNKRVGTVVTQPKASSLYLDSEYLTYSSLIFSLSSKTTEYYVQSGHKWHCMLLWSN